MRAWIRTAVVALVASLATTVLLEAQSALAEVPSKTEKFTTAESGVSAAALDNGGAGATTNHISMEGNPEAYANLLSLMLSVTPGTSTTVDVTCWQSDDADDWSQVPICDYADPKSDCRPDVRQYTLSEWTADSNGVKHITSNWETTKELVYCNALDSGAGTGTVTITGSRQWR